MKLNSARTLVLFSAILSVLGVAPSFSAETPFYRGKTLTVLINFAAGGPTDIEGRLVARFLGKHLPGQPAVVVQNMPGAGGVTGTNYLDEVAKTRRIDPGVFHRTVFQYFDRRSEPARRSCKIRLYREHRGGGCCLYAQGHRAGHPGT